MQRYLHPRLGGLFALLLASCSTDPGIMSADPGGGGSAGTSGGGTGTGGSGAGTSSAGGRGGTAGNAGGGPNFTFGVPDGGSSDARGGGNPTTGTSEMQCGLQRYKLERLPPELLLVLDRSGSMKSSVPGTGNNRWVEVTAALEEILMQTNNVVSWGLKMYPTTSACNVSNGVEVEVSESSTPVATAIKMARPNDDQGGTPTAAAVRTGTAYLMTRTSKNPKYVVLATDGEPNCPNNSGARMSIDAIADAKAAGFNVFVVGIATAGTGADRTLNDMAMAGGEARQGNPKYYPVANKKDLVDVLTQITVRVSNCVFPLDKQPPSPMDVAVNVDGMRLPREQWTYGTGMRSIEITGPVCEQLKAGKITDVQIIFGCPNVPIE